MKCSKCSQPLKPGVSTCSACGTTRPPLPPAFQQAEKEFVRLRAEFAAGSLTADQLKTAVEANRVEHGGFFWALGADTGSWYRYDGKQWAEADPPVAAGGSGHEPAAVTALPDAELKRPRAEFAHRPLHFIWMADCSGSMAVKGKIQALNNAIRECLPHMQATARDNPNAAVLVRAITFSDGARWHVGTSTPVEEFRWTDVAAGSSGTDLGKALHMVADELRIPPMTQRAYPPVLVLISDGLPTDQWEEGLAALMAEPWGRKAVRVAIAIGDDVDDKVLQEFIGDTGLQPLQANSPEALVNHIKWASTAVLKAASMPASQARPGGQAGVNVPVPMPVSTGTSVQPGDIW